MNNKIKKIIKKDKEINFHRISNSITRSEKKKIESNKKYKLPSKLKNKIDKYAKDVLGSKKYAPWLYVYTAYNEEFKEGWIPDNYYGWEMLSRINKNFREISSIKTISKRILNTELLPDKFYLIDNIIYDNNYKKIKNQDAFKEIFSEDKELFLKKNDSSQSKGILKLNKSNFNIENLLNYGNAVIQKSIKQHKWFNTIITGSVTTLRITTIKGVQGRIELVGSYLRIARKKAEYIDPVDIFKIAVVDKFGTINDFAIDPDWKLFYKHPETNFLFKNQIIPYYELAVDKCIKIHENLPQVGIIGWDVAINEEGETEIMEWNAGHPDIKFIEASIGPCFTRFKWDE